MQLTAPKGSAPKTKEQKRREAEARNRAYAALKNHRKRIAQLDEQMERDNARMEELLAMMADPDFYVNEDASSDAIAEHAKLKQRLAAAEEEWFTLTEELEAEMARQQERAWGSLRFGLRGTVQSLRQSSLGGNAHWAFPFAAELAW
ncbi:MAG: hypothetical protein ACLTDR_11415 [Adlercreutzia equolifaciens]